MYKAQKLKHEISGLGKMAQIWTETFQKPIVIMNKSGENHKMTF